MRKVIALISILVVTVVVFLFFSMKPTVDVVRVDLEINGVTIKALPGSYCRDGFMSSVCVDMIHYEDYSYDESQIDISGEVVAKVIAPKDFEEKEIVIPDLDGEIFSFILHSDKGDITFYIYVN